MSEPVVAAPAAQAIPGPRGHRWVGVIPEMATDPLRLFTATAREFGGLAALPFGGSRRAYLATHPEAVRRILQENARNYIRGDSVAPARLLLGDGIALSDGDSWLRRRRMMQPSFHRERLAGFHAMIVESAARALEGWGEAADRDAALNLAPELMRLTLDIIVKTMFGSDVSPQLPLLERNFTSAQAYIIGRTRNRLAPPVGWPTPKNLLFRRSRALLDSIVYDFIARARRSPQDNLLGHLLQATDESGAVMSDGEARDEVMTIFFAGHETTAVTLAWAFWLLSGHPQVEQELRAELQQVLGGRPPAFEDLERLTLLRRVLDETLRLYPPTWVLARQAVEADTLLGFPLPAGAFVMLSPYITHRHPDFWADPERFDPGRFTPENSLDRHHFAYYPFGGGPHKCIGNSFAMMEAQIILAMAMQRFRFTAVPGRPAVPHPEVTLRTRSGLWMSLQPC